MIVIHGNDMKVLDLSEESYCILFDETELEALKKGPGEGDDYFMRIRGLDGNGISRFVRKAEYERRVRRAAREAKRLAEEANELEPRT